MMVVSGSTTRSNAMDSINRHFSFTVLNRTVSGSDTTVIQHTYPTVRITSTSLSLSQCVPNQPINEWLLKNVTNWIRKITRVRISKRYLKLKNKIHMPKYNI